MRASPSAWRSFAGSAMASSKSFLVVPVTDRFYVGMSPSASWGPGRALRALVEEAIDSNLVWPEGGSALLHQGAEFGAVESPKVLVRAGAELEIRRRSDWTTPHRCAGPSVTAATPGSLTAAWDGRQGKPSENQTLGLGLRTPKITMPYPRHAPTKTATRPYQDRDTPIPRPRHAHTKTTTCPYQDLAPPMRNSRHPHAKLA